MIFTRRFGALRARPTFPSVTTIELEQFDAQRKAELKAHKTAAAKADVRTHHLFRRGNSAGKHHAA